MCFFSVSKQELEICENQNKPFILYIRTLLLIFIFRYLQLTVYYRSLCQRHLQVSVVVRPQYKPTPSERVTYNKQSVFQRTTLPSFHPIQYKGTMNSH